MGFKKLVYFMLSMIKESSQNALERFFAVNGEDTYMTQQAFSEARQKIKWEAFREMFDHATEVQYTNEIELWRGMRVSASDGSKMSLPNDKPLQEFFGTAGGGNKSATAQGSLLYDLFNNIVMDARIEPISVDERTIAWMHIKHLQELKSFKEWKELIIFDRGYSSKELFADLLSRKIHCLMRVREKFSTQIDALGRGDHVIELCHGEKLIRMRVIKFRLSSGEIETLITDIMDKTIKMKEFKKLYFKRWPIETKYDELKKKLEIENFSGRLVDNIRQDFFAAMVITNIAADFFSEAQQAIEKEQEKKQNKYQYQVNLNHEIGVLKDHLIKTLIEEDDIKRGQMFDLIVELIKKRVIPKRPNRSFPRKTPRRVRFHQNHKSNC